MAHANAPALAPDDQALENQALDSLCAHLRSVADRRAEHGKVHQLHAVLCLVVLGLLTGHTGLSATIAFALGAGARRRYYGVQHRRRAKQRSPGPTPAPEGWLYRIGLLWRGSPTVPCLMTLIRLLSGLTLADLQAAMTGWVLELLSRLREQPLVVRVDGKAMKAADRHVLSAFVQDLGLVLLHEEVDEKKNELSVFRAHLLELRGRYPGLWLVCGDALFAETKLCEALKYNGRDWLFQIKANQKNLLEKLELVFSPIVRTAPHFSSEPEKKSGLPCPA
jgi:hypothetical protein